jgi:two-component system sensor histidine kinase AgrC
MEETSRLRHDFRQTLHIISEFASHNELEQLNSYLEKYHLVFSSEQEQYFCQNAALNAIISYYNNIAVNADIQTKWEIHLPAKLPLSEVEFCTMLGNLLENAVLACKTVPSDQRYMKVFVAMEGGQQLFLLICNSFDGNLKFDKEKLVSTRHSGRGMGLESVQSTVTRYKGRFEYEHDAHEFLVKIFMHV